MAKRQMKSNKEIKKPKQVKAKPAADNGLTARLTAAQDKAKGPKKQARPFSDRRRRDAPPGALRT